MSRALEQHAVRPADISLINHQYLHCCGNTTDPTMVWGTDVDVEDLLPFIQRQNATSASLISLAHVLVKAVADSLARFPQLNCRIIGGRIYRFRDVAVRIVHCDPETARVNILSVPQADQLRLVEISRLLWESQLQLATGEYRDNVDQRLLNVGPVWLRRLATRAFWRLDRTFRLPRIGRIDRHLDASVVVNYLGHAGAPPMRAYKPSKFPDESSLLSVTMGRIESRPVVHDGQLAIRRIAPLFIRADHRVTDAQQLARFVADVRQTLQVPTTLEALASKGISQNIRVA